MIRYFLETLFFQILFLAVYDALLKRETFFQWNRAYLLGTFALSLLLPKLHLAALGQVVPQQIRNYSQALWQLDPVEVVAGQEQTFWNTWTWYEWVLILGSLLAALLFVYKLFKLYTLARQGKLVPYQDHYQLLLPQSDHAFSFFKLVFLGDQLPQPKKKAILAHELVHVRQNHSLDQLFFELARIVFWFNPMVYVYQKRMAEVHEFIADGLSTQSSKKEQYQLLLSQAFQTENISFINPFFSSSLIKKRIVMLQKQKSKNALKFKYLLLLPLLLAILLYTSCEQEATVGDEADTLKTIPLSERLIMSDEKGNAVVSDDIDDIPFSSVDQVPVFPGCEDATDQRKCFTQKMQEHIVKNFRYPEAAQSLGLQGRVNLLFIIGADGSINDIRYRGPDPILEAEAVRIIKLLPHMQPGKSKGKAVNVPFSIPITFKLQQ